MFNLTNPILDCETNNFSSKFIIFSNDLSKKVEEVKKTYSINHISLYYRDLNNGPWVGVEEKEFFSPASLLKVPILISALYQAESDPNLLNKKVLISDIDLQERGKQNILTNYELISGKEYTVYEVLENMIKKSDDAAINPILKLIDKNKLGSVFKSIGVPYDGINKEIPVRVKDYAGFFRVLFNASYLNREMSEKALNILTNTDYSSGIVAGVPKNIVVAHKFGEREIEKDFGKEKQLHDCGIVYYPNSPYILCVMTRGNNFDNQEKSIKEISSFIFNEIDKN